MTTWKGNKLIRFRQKPTFLSTPVHYGGLGWTPAQIGRLLSIRAVLNGFFQVFFFSKLHNRFGSKRIFIAGVCAFYPIFALFKVINIAAKEGRMDISLLLLGVQVFLSLIVTMSYGTLRLPHTRLFHDMFACAGTVMMYINSSAPNTKSIGATNGVCQTLVRVVFRFSCFISHSPRTRFQQCAASGPPQATPSSQ